MLRNRDETWCVSLCSALDSLRQSSAFSDVIISAEDGRILRAHTCVLAAASSILKTELSTDCHQLHIPGISGPTWEAVLCFVYTGEVHVTKAQDKANLLKACQQLGLDQLAKLCGKYCCDNKTEASASSKQHCCKTAVRTEELATSLSSVHQKDVKVTIVDIQSETNEPKSAVIELESLDMSSAAALYIRALLTNEIQQESSTVELDTNAIAEDVSLRMLPLKKEELTTDGKAQETDQESEQTSAARQLDSGSDDKRQMVKTTMVGRGRKKRGKYKGNSNEFTCEVCGKAFSHLSRLKFHSNIHTGERPYACGQCGKTFNHSSNLTRHERTHTGVRPHMCPECGRGFQRASDMQVHVQRMHCAEKPFACELCLKEFSMEIDLKNHMYQHMDEKPFKCSRCDKSFAKNVNLVTHLRMHTGERPFACKVCAMTFKDTSNLARHRRIHTGIKPFECSFCGKAFLRKGDLIGHQRIHTEEKPFVCSQCGKAFTFRTSLDMHTRLHTGEKPYMCDICGKTFTRNCQLLDHHMTHTGKKPFQCCTCGRNFSTKKNLASHERVHLETKPFECHLCGKSFRWASALKKHVVQCSQ